MRCSDYLLSVEARDGKYLLCENTGWAQITHSSAFSWLFHVSYLGKKFQINNLSLEWRELDPYTNMRKDGDLPIRSTEELKEFVEWAYEKSRKPLP